MNRIFTFIFVLMAFAAIARADDKPVAFEKLPEEAKNFIHANFPGEKFSFATRDKDFAGASYDVRFVSGLKIEFNGKGEWTEIESKVSVINEKFVPVQIRNYVSGRWEGVQYKKVEKKRFGGHEIKLTNGIELEFDRNFNVMEIDD